MLAVDSSTMIAFLQGQEGEDVSLLGRLLHAGEVILPPTVLSELCSNPRLTVEARDRLCALPLLDTLDGYWLRVGLLRASILATGRKARLADTLIAQSCIDKHLALLTRDYDFRHYVEYGGLVLCDNKVFSVGH